MSKYMIFEAGSRCGFSAEYFFKQYRNEFGTDDELIEVDINPYFQELGDDKKNGIVRVGQDEAEKMIADDESIIIFPADELTRQSNSLVRQRAYNEEFSYINSWMYDKRKMNKFIGENDDLSAPKTFENVDVFVRPNTMSAGSKNVGRHEYCVTEYIDIEMEYVVDVDNCNGYTVIYPREVSLQHGYDKYIRFVDPMSREFEQLDRAVKCFLKKFGKYGYKIFHLQLARDRRGKIYYIESSKRLSGTSIVHSLFGYNPFASLNNKKHDFYKTAEFDKWYRYEDLITML